MLAFCAASWTAQVALSLLSHALSSALNPAVQRELTSPRGIWRPQKEPLMLYPLLGAPLVHAVALHQLHAALRLPSVAGDARSACALAAMLWAAGPLHGMLINYASLKVSANVTGHFALTTLACALVNGLLLAQFAS
jgi:hypothetical protein